MNPDLQRRVQRYGWDKASSHYERYWQEQLSPAHNQLFKSLDILPGMKILDVACGSGQLTFSVAEKTGDSGMVTGTDLSDKMIALGAMNAKSKNASNVFFKQMDAEALEFEDNSFDMVFSSLGLMYFPDPAKSLREMFRVLKPGGQCGLAVWGERKNCGWADVFEIVDKRVVSEVCPMFFQYGNEVLLTKTLESVGFVSIRTQKISTLLSYNEDMDACGAAFAGGPVALAYDKFSDEVKNEVHFEYIDSIKNYKTLNGFEIPGEFLICTCRKP
jgi:ubiquinone/menaquinone biosynthesis C-methylase UbiE